MDPRQIKKKDLTFKAGKKPGKFWIISAWVLIIIFTVSCVAIIVTGKTAKPPKAQGNLPETAVSENQLEINRWKEEVARDPGNTASLSNLAYCYQQMKQYPQAEEYYKRCLAVDPKYKFAISRLGVVYIAMKKYDKAQAVLENGLKADPNNTECYLGLCLLNIEQKNYDEAAVCAEKVVKIDPLNFGAYENLAYIYKLQGDTAGAVKVLKEGQSIATKCGDSQYQMRFSALIDDLSGKKK